MIRTKEFLRWILSKLKKEKESTDCCMILDKIDFVKLIEGYGCFYVFINHSSYDKYKHLIKFTGNQWNKNWEFNEDKLIKMSIWDLRTLFEILKKGWIKKNG